MDLVWISYYWKQVGHVLLSHSHRLTQTLFGKDAASCTSHT